MNNLTITHIQDELKNGNLTCVSLVDSLQQRIEAFNPKLNAFIYQDLAANRRLAEARDKITPENWGPLHGVPISIKECFLWEQTPSTLNFPLFKNYKAKQTSRLVQRLLDAGAIPIGKTNVPILLTDSQTFGPLYPTANNPYDLTRTPGGSTGGGAAAVAAGLSVFELGSDIGGSIRNPAHYCGLFGIKPTENGYASDGHVPPYPESGIGLSVLNHTGPLARNMADLRSAYDVLYAPDWERLHYLPIEKKQKPHTEDPAYPLSGWRVGYFSAMGTIVAGQDVQAGVEKTCRQLEKLGATIEPIHFDTQLIQRILKNWATLFGFMLGQNLSWTVRKLFYFKFLPALRASSLNASESLKLGLSQDFKVFSQALAERELLIQEVNRCFASFDVVVSPTSMGPAFHHNPKHRMIALDGQQVPYLDYCFPFVAFYNLTGHPVLTVPTGCNKDGLPIGVSLSADHHQEPMLFQVGELLEREGFQFTPPSL